jgi:hypothetical protein
LAPGKGGKGGRGGDGGPGGPGAGGNGGPSYALVYQGTEPEQTDTTLVAGTGGPAGPGGLTGTLQAPFGNLGPAEETFAVPQASD